MTQMVKLGVKQSFVSKVKLFCTAKSPTLVGSFKKHEAKKDQRQRTRQHNQPIRGEE